MASGPITTWQTDGATIETMTDFILGGSKITADGDCSHEIKRHLLLGRKAMKNLDSILKSRDITLPTKVHLVKAMVFPVVTYGCESWTIKKDEHQNTNAFELWCWRRLLRVPWTSMRSNQSILKEISPKYLLEGLMLKLKLKTYSQHISSILYGIVVTLITMLYMSSSEFSHLITESLYPLTYTSPFPPACSPWQPSFHSLLQCNRPFFRFYIRVIQYSICPSLFGLFQLA